MILHLRRAGVVAAILAAMFGLSCLITPPAFAADASRRAERLPLAISGHGKVHHFRVELADTPAKQARGLMYRTGLDRDGGMIFPFPFPRDAAFWMRNTLIPLDIIFIRADGTIARIAANAVPESLDLIEAGEPVSAVLEIAGGGAAARGIVAGDHVSWGKRRATAP